MAESQLDKGKGRLYFSSQVQVFRSVVVWSLCFWACGEAAYPAAEWCGGAQAAFKGYSLPLALDIFTLHRYILVGRGKERS